MERTLQIQSPYGKGMTIKTLQGNEGISQLYEFKLTLTSKDPNLGNNGIGQPLTTSIDTEQTTRYLSGIITDFGYLHEDPDELDYHLYTCTVRPSLWYLSQRIDSRVFVDKTVLDIAATLLGELGVSYQNNCQNGYRTYGHSTQYQETSLDYLNRLFEQEGIYYYFEHSAGNHTLILADNNAQHKPILGKTTLPYHSKYIAAGTPDQAYIDTWQHTDHLNTKQVSVNDYNYQMAKTKLTASGSTHSLGGQSTEQYDFYTNFKNPGQADHYKTVRTEDHKAHSQSITASGNVLTIAPGYTFSLERHPHQAANSEYLITQAHYDFQEAGYTTGQDLSHYRIDFTAIPKSHQYRAPRHTPKPRMLGTQAAIVTGPAGEEVYTNEYGDIKVQFHWDRYGPMNEKSSDWIRVIQGSAGGSFGSINTPRIGEEVLVDFINGDSDRPIVVGRLYNSANPPPWGFPAAAKKSGIKSKSFNSPLSNFNELMFDDTASSELVNFQAQKDLTSLIKHDETRTVNHDRTTTIDNDETVTIHGFRTETVDKDETITIHQNRTETVDKNETITIHENRKERVDKDETISIGGNRTETVEKNEKIDVHGNRDEAVKKNETVTINQNQKHTVQKNRSLTVNHNNTEMVKIAKSVTVGTVYTTQVGVAMNTLVGMMQAEEVGMVKKTMVGKNYGITAGEQFQIKVGDSSLILNSDGSIVLQGKSILIQAEKDNTIIGNDVHINPEPVEVKNLDEEVVSPMDSENNFLNQNNPSIQINNATNLGNETDKARNPKDFTRINAIAKYYDKTMNDGWKKSYESLINNDEREYGSVFLSKNTNRLTNQSYYRDMPRNPNNKTNSVIWPEMQKGETIIGMFHTHPNAMDNPEHKFVDSNFSNADAYSAMAQAVRNNSNLISILEVGERRYAFEVEDIDKAKTYLAKKDFETFTSSYYDTIRNARNNFLETNTRAGVPNNNEQTMEVIRYAINDFLNKENTGMSLYENVPGDKTRFQEITK